MADKKFGSTRRGIAPVYADKFYKKTIRMGDLLTPEILQEKLMRAFAAESPDTDKEALLDAYTEWLLSCWEEAGVIEDTIGVAEVCLNLK